MKARNFLCLIFVLLCSLSINAQVTGTVFRDYNGNGTRDTNEPLLPGVTVNAYNAGGSLCGTATTTAGATATNYSLTGCGTSAVRVEFVIPASGSCVSTGLDYSSLSGTAYGSSVQFVNGNSSNVNFAIHNPNDYNIGTANVSVFIPCYISGDPLVPGTSADGDWFVGYPYTNVGNSVSTPPSQKINGSVIGPTWGVAYSKQAQKVFTSALLKRHVGLGSLGSGGIYMLTTSGGTFTVNSFYDLDANGHRTRAEATAPAYGEGTSYSIASNSIVTYLGSNDPLTGKPSGLGVIGTNVQRGLTANPLDPSYDPAAFDQVGKVGIGDIEISDDGKFLFVMNLYSRKVFRLELNDAYNPTTVINVTSYDVPATTCNAGEYRPWALKFFRNKLFIGLVCSGENGPEGDTGNLTASVYELNNPTGVAAFNTSAVLTLPLNYNKNGDYNPWTNDSNIPSGTSLAIRYATPLLSDIEFTDNGDMVLGIMDRCGNQWGENNRRFLKTNTTSITISTSGDVLIAGLNCGTGTFTLENNGSVSSANGTTLTGVNTQTNAGPGGREFFDDNSSSGDPHDETATGALALLKGQGQLVLSAFAQSSESGDAGTMKLSTTNGDFVNYYELYNRNDFDGVFAKANGLGDVELSGIEAPIEIGNRVWTDTDSDGIQDAGEVPISGVTVQLIQGTTVIGTATTDGNGNYYFSSAAGTNTASSIYGITQLDPNMTYIVRIPNVQGGSKQAALGTNSLTLAKIGGAGQPDVRDSDGILVGNNAEATVLTSDIGVAGANNHNFDFGFGVAPAAICGICPPELTITGLGFGSGSAPQSEDVTLNSGVNVLPENNIAGFLSTGSTEGVFYALCTEISQPVAPLQNPYAHAANGSANGFTSQQALRIAQVFQAAGFSTASGFGSGNNTTTNMVAMQMAVWNAMYDTDYSITTGPFQMLTNNNPGVRTLANSWLASAQLITSPNTPVHRLTNPMGQDLVFQNCITTEPGICNSTTNTYSLTGNISFANAPTSGTLTVSVSGGGSQVFNAPFTSPQAYNITGLTADGASHTVTAVFSADITCTATATYNAPASCTPTCTLDVTCTPQPQTSCSPANGSASVASTGVQGTVSYLWSSGETTMSISGKGAGTYTVTVTDSFLAGCTATCQAVITSTITLPTATCSKTDNTNCGTPNGTASVTTDANQIAWSTGATTANITGLSAGTYTVTVTNTTTGCTNTCQAVIINNTTNPTVSCSKTDNTNCATPNGSATAMATGVTYLWSNNATTSTITGISNGTYTVTVTSTTSGCTATCSAIVGSTTTLPTATCSKTDNTNCGTPNGTASVTTDANQIAWSTGANNPTITGLPNGTYTVTVTNSSTGCTNTCQAVVNNSTVNPSCSITTNTQPSCANLTGGSITVVPTPAGTYTYAWSDNGPATATRTGLAGGTYTVTVTNTTSNCTGVCNVTLTTPTNCCSIAPIAPQNLECLDNGTPNKISDNRIRFTVNVTNSNTLLTTYNVTINGGTTITPNTNVPYGVTQFLLGPGTAGGGATFSVTVTDSATPGCTQTFQVADPGTCNNTTPCLTPKCGTATIQVNSN